MTSPPAAGGVMGGPVLARRSFAPQPKGLAPIPSPISGPPPPPAGPAGALPGWRAALHRMLALGTDRVARERELSAMIGRRPSAPRVVAFVAGKGGVGTSTAAAGTALTLAALRPGEVALAATRTGALPLGVRVGEGPAPDAAAYATGTVPLAALAPLTGLTVIDSAPWDTPLSRPALSRLITDLREDHAFTVLDVGDDGTEIGHGALARADRVVVVTTGALDAVAATERTLHRLQGVRAHEAVRTVVVVTGVRRLGRTGAGRRAYPRGGSEQVIHLPWDPGLDEGAPIELERLRRATRAAYLQIAAAVATEQEVASG